MTPSRDRGHGTLSDQIPPQRVAAVGLGGEESEPGADPETDSVNLNDSASVTHGQLSWRDQRPRPRRARAAAAGATATLLL